eukprot:3332510-Lingulodinium_polyedra.AAC.1
MSPGGQRLLWRRWRALAACCCRSAWPSGATRRTSTRPSRAQRYGGLGRSWLCGRWQAAPPLAWAASSRA